MAAQTIKQIRALADEVWRMTAAAVVTGDINYLEVELEDYESLLAQRQPLIDKMAALHSQADFSGHADAKAEIDGLLKRIAQADEGYQEIFRQAKTTVQTALKNIKDRRKLNNVYTPVADHVPAGRLDARQ